MNIPLALSPIGRLGRRLRASVLILTAVSTAVLFNPAPAVAGQTGMQKCLSGAQPNVSIPFTQTGGGNDGFPGGPNPPNGIFPGNALHVVVNESAQVSISHWNTEWYGIDGKNEYAPSSFPFPGWKSYVDVFRMNNNPGGWVASGSDPNPWNPHYLRELNVTACWAAPNAPVRMGFGMNDNNLGDNTGSWKWTLQIWRND
ncbi:hypothetical protein ACWEQL_38180 [Kitasatospora sp. NPDC004240]